MTVPPQGTTDSGLQMESSVRSRRRETWLAALVLLLLITGVHYDVIFQGRSLVLTNHLNPLDYRPLPQNYGEHLVPAEVWTQRNLWPYANIQDPGGSWWQWDPSGEFLERAMKTGEWPFWDPYVAAGTPAMANLTPAFFFPPYTVMVALGDSVFLKNTYLLLLLWTSAFFSFLFLRRHGLLFLSSISGAVVVLMSGSLNQFIGTIMGQAGSCLPLAIYVTRLFLDRPNRWRTIGVVLVYAAIALASFPPVLLGVFGFTTLYVLVALAVERSADDRKLRARTVAQWGGAVALSMGLVSFYYFPALALRAAARYSAAFYNNAGLESMPLFHVYQLLSPTLAGGVVVYQAPPVPAGMLPHLPYLGVTALLAAMLAQRRAGSRYTTLLYASAIGAITIGFKLLGFPPVQWIASLPMLNQIHFAHYFGLPLGFLLAFISALGIESLLRGWATRWRSFVAVFVVVIASHSLWYVAFKFNVLQSAADVYWVRDWLVVSIAASMAALATLTGTFVPRLRTAAAGLLLIGVIAEGVFNNSYPSPDSWDIFEHPVPYVQTLQHEAAMTRVLTFGAPNANLNDAFEVATLDSVMAFNPPRIFALYKRYTEAPVGLLMREATHIPPEPVLDRANIGFVATRNAFVNVLREARGRGYSVRFDDAYVTIFQRRTLARFFFSSEYRVMRTSSALDAVAEVPSLEVLLERTPAFSSTANSPNDPVVQVESYRRNSVKLSVDAPRPGLVYASESYFEGWTATVNNVPVRILPANYAFRAIAIPAGRSQIEFRYWPPGLTRGLFVSSVSAFALLALTVVPRRTLPSRVEARPQSASPSPFAVGVESGGADPGRQPAQDR